MPQALGHGLAMYLGRSLTRPPRAVSSESRDANMRRVGGVVRAKILVRIHRVVLICKFLYLSVSFFSLSIFFVKYSHMRATELLQTSV